MQRGRLVIRRYILCACFFPEMRVACCGEFAPTTATAIAKCFLLLLLLNRMRIWNPECEGSSKGQRLDAIVSERKETELLVVVEIEIEIYPLQKGRLRTSFPRWGVTVMWKEGCMHVGPIVAPSSTMAYIK